MRAYSIPHQWCCETCILIFSALLLWTTSATQLSAIAVIITTMFHLFSTARADLEQIIAVRLIGGRVDTDDPHNCCPFPTLALLSSGYLLGYHLSVIGNGVIGLLISG